MEIRNKNILLVSPEPWDHIFVSKHHYAIHFGKRGNKVYFLNPPTESKEILDTSFENVWQINYTGFPKGLRFYPIFLQKYIVKLIYEEVQKFCDVKFDIVWSFDNSVFYDFSALPNCILKISHIVDLNQNFQSARAASTANICFCTTDFIKKRLSKFNKNTYKINHGVSLSKLKLCPTLPGVSNIKVMYVGNLAMRYLDWQQLCKTVVSVGPNIDFIFIGSGKDEVSLEINEMHHFKKKIQRYENVFFLDKVPSGHIKSYLSKADVLLISYQEDYHKDQANPHKMMEYLSSGKMIVATYTQEFINLAEEGVILMAKENREFSDLFQSAVHNLVYWNSIEKQQERKFYAMDNTYEKQVSRIETFIKDSL